MFFSCCALQHSRRSALPCCGSWSFEEDYGYEQILDPGRARLGVTLGENEYFVMGDNRNHSEDSRFMLVGNISKDKILGKVIMRLWPLEKYGYIDLYMERTKDDNGQD